MRGLGVRSSWALAFAAALVFGYALGVWAPWKTGGAGGHTCSEAALFELESTFPHRSGHASPIEDLWWIADQTGFALAYCATQEGTIGPFPVLRSVANESRVAWGSFSVHEHGAVIVAVYPPLLGQIDILGRDGSPWGRVSVAAASETSCGGSLIGSQIQLDSCGLMAEAVWVEPRPRTLAAKPEFADLTVTDSAGVLLPSVVHGFELDNEVLVTRISFAYPRSGLVSFVLDEIDIGAELPEPVVLTTSAKAKGLAPS